MISEIREFDEFVESRAWRFAVTYAKICPHEYLVCKGVDREFKDVAEFVRRNGFSATYKGRQGVYFIRGNYYYWDMGEPLERVIILNRARLSDYMLINREWVWQGEEERLRRMQDYIDGKEEGGL